MRKFYSLVALLAILLVAPSVAVAQDRNVKDLRPVFGDGYGQRLLF